MSRVPGRRPPDLLLPALIVGAGLTCFAAISFFTRHSQSDFTMFYDSGAAWNAGTSPYDTAHANLNPPSIVATVFGPLARLPYHWAQLLWATASAMSLTLSIREIVRVLALGRTDTLCWLAVIGLTYPWALLWFGGQVTFLLMYPFTRAWGALRANRMLEGGAWLSPIIVFKPPFAVMALLLPVRTSLTAGIVSALIFAVTLPITGWSVWREWFSFLGQVSWLAWADNASLWGVVSRAVTGQIHGGAVSDLPPAIRVSLVGLAGLAAIRVVCARSADARVALALVWMLLFLPLGWVYYSLLAAGPFRAMWNGGRWGWTTVLLLCVPLPLAYQLATARWSVVAIGSVYAWALVSAWVAISSVDGKVPRGDYRADHVAP